uniref:Cytochrome b561 domain-containing protein n=1 Tax=Leersia perrieri TaxID=77586 RepID=A0A0D9X3D6_9ORYZ
MAKGDGGVGAWTVVAHVLAVAATALVLIWCIHFRGGLALRSHNKQLIFNIHPVLMLIGPIVLGAEAILSYRSLIKISSSREVRKKAHLALHGVALAVGAVGIYAVFKYHAEADIPDLYSLHSWIGIATISLYALNWLAAFLTFFFPKASPDTRRSVVPWHALLGLLIFGLAIATALLGFLEKLTFLQAPPMHLVSRYGAEALLVNFTALIVLFLGGAVLLATANIDSTRYTAM